MLEIIIFTSTTVLPVFITILIGYYVRKMGVITLVGAKEINNLVFKLMLPLMLFGNIAMSDFSQLFDLNFIFFVSAMTIIIFFISWIYGEVFVKERKLIGTFVQGAFRGNYALLSLVLISNVLGEEAVARGSIVGPIVIPIYNVFSVIILSIRGKGIDKLNKNSIKLALINLTKNPIILSVVFALPFSIFNVTFPTILEETIIFIGKSATPVALIGVGASFNLKNISNKLKVSSVAVFIKIIFSPIISMYVAYILGFDNTDLVIIALIMGSPTAISSYVMATSINGDSELAADILVMTTLLSIFTLTGIIAFSKYVGII